MKRFINTVTVTGADDSIKPHELVPIAQEYPYVEFALLLSRKQQGNRRFPSNDWLNEYDADNCLLGQKTAIHLCGKWVEEVLEGNMQDDIRNILKCTYGRRIQLNTHGIKHKFEITALVDFLESMKENGNYVIFQNDDANTDLLKTARESGYHNISALFDLSHGAGVSPEEWPLPMTGIYCGYAGGLGPHNIEDQLEELEKVVGHRHIWIDAETHLRSLDDVKFDLGKVRSFLAGASDAIL